MSIQRRLAISITFVLLFSLAVGCGLTYEHVIAKVRTELQAALAVGAYSALNVIDDKDAITDPQAKLRRVVGEFDGDRHVKAVLAADGKVVAQSQPLTPDDPAPGWFYRLVDTKATSRVLRLPEPLRSFGSLTLLADPHNEVAEAWSDIRLTLTIMVVFFAMVLALAFLTIKAALSPLRDVRAALERIGSGNYGARIDQSVSHELAPLREGFNRMAARLEEMGQQNRALNEQLMTLQEEERAELARDLHDDVAPFLFAVGADSAMIRQYIAKGAFDDVAARAEGIAESVKHMQRHVKEVLRRLAPGALLELGLAGAIDNLTGFWRARRPNVAFSIEVTGDSLDSPLDAIAFRVVQESISNAIRHGQPNAVDVFVEVDDARASIVVEDDGVGFAGGQPTFGFGLTGMQERVRSVGGRFQARNRTGTRGVIVEALLPTGRKAAADELHKVDVPA